MTSGLPPAGVKGAGSRTCTYIKLIYNVANMGREPLMASPRSTKSPRKPKKSKKSTPSSPLIVRLDEESKGCLVRAAEMRRISLSDYVRHVTVAQARRELDAARQHSIALTPAEQLAFWNALNETPVLTPAQRELGAIIRGEA